MGEKILILVSTCEEREFCNPEKLSGLWIYNGSISGLDTNNGAYLEQSEAQVPLGFALTVSIHPVKNKH